MALENAEVTVLIPVRNGEEFIAEAIESVLEQTFTRWTMLIRDNHSHDGTVGVVGRYLADPRIRLITGDTDLSMAGNFNACLDAVQTKYYTLLCHDDYLFDRSALQAGYAVMEEHADIPAVYCDLVYVNRERLPIAKRRFKRSGRTAALVVAKNSILRTRNLFGIPLIARTSSLKGLRYDESLPYIIDLDLSIATARGADIFHIPKLLIANRYHGRNSSGALLRGVVGQMQALAQRHGIPLNRIERALMTVSACGVTVAKHAFLFYARRSARSGAKA